MSQRKKQGLARLWQLVTLLDRSHNGITMTQLQERLGMSRASVYRYLDDLARAGVGVARETVTGETRLRLLGKGLPAITPTPRQLAALHFARQALDAWEGTDVVEQLDALLARWGCLPQESIAASRRRLAGSAPALLRTIETALRDGVRVAIEYQGTNDTVPRRREVEPVVLHEQKGEVYLLGYDHERTAYRTYKVARITSAQALAQRVSDHSALDPKQAFAKSVKVWRSAELESVVVRLSAGVARYATEYPLSAEQTVEAFGDGSVVVRAKVPGVTEAMRWVLSWGKEAEAIAPQALRDAVRAQVEGAVAGYRAGERASGLRKGVASRPAEAEESAEDREAPSEARRA